MFFFHLIAALAAAVLSLPPPPPPPPLLPLETRFVITGYCDSRSDLDKLEYVADSRTAWNDDSPIYRDTSLGTSYVRFDTEELAWVVTKRSDVYARFNSDDSSSPPLGTATWQVDCGGGGYTRRYTDHNLTLARSQPLPPPPPPLPPEVKAVMSMCFVATRRQFPDADSLRQVLVSSFKLVWPQVQNADGCDLPNFDRINQSSKICSVAGDTCESGDLLRILPKTSKATSQVVVGTSGSSLVGSEGEAGRTAVYSVTVLDFVDLAKGSQSWLSRFCGKIVSEMCSNRSRINAAADQTFMLNAAADPIPCRNYARAVCYPPEGIAGEYLNIAVFDTDSEETSIAALRVLDPEWSVDSPPPWSSLDVIWMLLWLLPAWVPALLLPAGAVARRRAFRRAKVLLELEGALSEIEVEQKQSRFDEPEVRKAVRQARWLAFTLLLLALALVPWPPLVALAAVLPLARKTSCEVWITSRASRRYWLSVASVSGLIYGAWLIASWSLIGTGEYESLYKIGAAAPPDRVFVSTCRQLLQSSPDDAVDSTDTGYFLDEYRGKVCSVLADMLSPRNIPFIAWTLLAQGCVSLLVAVLSLLLLLKSAGPKAVPGGRRLASSGWCGAANVDGLLTLATERTADRFAGSAKELVTGQPEAGCLGPLATCFELLSYHTHSHTME